MVDLENILTKIRKYKDSKYSILIYIGVMILASIWTVYNLCLTSIILPLLAILIPLKLFKENSLKKIAISGLIAILVIIIVLSVYQLSFFYNQPIDVVNSQNLENGSIDKVYGNTEESFNFTVGVSENIENNYTVYLNLSHSRWIEGESQDINESYKMKPLDDNSTYYYQLKVNESVYLHHYSLKQNFSGNLVWEETDQALGPLTIPIMSAFSNMIISNLPPPVIIFLFMLLLLFWRRTSGRGKKKSTEGLEEKEEELEDYCPECGTLLKGKDICQKCGTEVRKKVEEERKLKEKEEDLEPKKICLNCGKRVDLDKKECPNCGEPIKSQPE